MPDRLADRAKGWPCVDSVSIDAPAGLLAREGVSELSELIERPRRPTLEEWWAPDDTPSRSPPGSTSSRCH